MGNQKGFTLIELVVVIVILGILAAVAVPKFIAMQSDARIASINGLSGAIRSASSLAHAQALVKGFTAASGETINMDGQPVDLVYGYPADAAGGIDEAVNYEGFTFAGGVFTLQTGCTVTYVDPASAGAAPTITVATGGCN